MKFTKHILKSIRRKLYAMVFLLFFAVGAIGYLIYHVDDLETRIAAKDVCVEGKHLSKIPFKVCEIFVICQVKENDMKKCLTKAFLEAGDK